MSKVKKTIGLDRVGIETLPVPEAVKQYLRQMVGLLEQMHETIRENIESGVLTKNWRAKEVGANLEFQKNGVMKGGVTDP
jgi:hypothetical protein